MSEDAAGDDGNGDGDDDDDGAIGEEEEEAAFVGNSASASSSGVPRTAAELRIKRAAELDSEENFPDELDTPLDPPANERFGRYRAVKSFRTSPWDPRESLPSAYSRIFSLPHFAAVKSAALEEVTLTGKAQLTLAKQRMEQEREEKRALRHADAAKKLTARHASSNSSASSSSSASATGMQEDEVRAKTLVDDDDDDAGETEQASASASSSTILKKSASSASGDGGLGASVAGKLSEVLGSDWIAVGQFICIAIDNVPLSAVYDAAVPGVPLSLFSLLRHENRASVMHFNVQRTDSYTEPIKGKVCIRALDNWKGFFY